MGEIGLLGAWMLGSGVMLLWCAAVAVPIVIHWWSRRRFQETSWAAMEFLLAALRKNARRLRLEQWLLLAVRMTVLALLAVALADPVWTPHSGSLRAVAPRQIHHIFVVDTSYSMAHRRRVETRLESAQAAIRNLLDDSRDGDAFSLLRLENPPRQMTAELTFDRNEVLREVDQLRVSDGGADLYATLLALDGMIERARRRPPGLDHLRVYWLTDVGRTTWDAAASANCRKFFERWEDHVEMSMIDVGAEGGPNLAITALRCDRSLVTAGQELRLEAEVRSFGASHVADARVRFLINGHLIQSRDVQVPAGGQTTAVVSHRFDGTGDMAVEARLDVDELAIDNERWLVVTVRKSLDVLCIAGEPEAADFVALAMNPNSSSTAPLHADVAPETALLDRPLQAYDAVFLNNVARVSPDEADSLRGYVDQGGGLVITVGDRVQADNYNQALGDTPGGVGLLPGRLSEVVAEGPHFFDPRDYQHPLTAPFRGFERAGLLTVPTWRYLRAEPLKSLDVEVPLAFDNGDVAILGKSHGQGRSLLVLTALSPSSQGQAAEGLEPWSALPAWPSFPPLVHGLARWAASGREGDRHVTVGTPLRIMARDALAADCRLTLPDGTNQRIASETVDGISQVSFADTAQRGIYQADFSAEDSVIRRLYAANIDPSESDPVRTAPSELPRAFSGAKFASSLGRANSLPGTIAFFRWLLAVVAGLLLMESGLACWLERRSA